MPKRAHPTQRRQAPPPLPLQESDSDDDGVTPVRTVGVKAGRGRQDNSLSVLTRKFIELIQRSPDKTVDLNEAV